ncbi:MAG TPA: CopG family transcriptional regulator [Actinomycetota bacterium]|jgi:metal-responsive CopG/Arc/MetJ family transcriptional regulator|nr:CopG family transcriptional regulator [Actinomycetota bacterium]
MARKQVIVQLDEELVAQLDRTARREGVSRSELIRRGVRALLDGGSEAEAVRRLVEAYVRLPQEAWVVEAGRTLASELDLGPPPRE